MEIGHFQAKFIGHFSPMYFHFWLLRSLESWKFENRKVHKHLHLWLLRPHRRRLAVRSGTSKGSTISQYGCSTFGALAIEVQQKRRRTPLNPKVGRSKEHFITTTRCSVSENTYITYLRSAEGLCR